MRKFISFILLVIFLFISDGYYILFEYLRYNVRQEIKHDIKNGLDEKQLSLIVVPLNIEKEIFWIKKDKEFRYKGAMYDVVRTEIKGRKKYYYCVKDIKEQQLFVNFAKNFRQNNKMLLLQKRKITNKYFSKYSSLKTYGKKSDFDFPEYQQSYKSRIIDVASPPPKFNLFTS